MATPTKIVYENYCMICGTKTITSELSIVLTKSGQKNEIATENVGSRHICVCCNCKKKCFVFTSARTKVITLIRFSEQIANHII